MPMTDEFRKILRNEKRRIDNDMFFESAINKAVKERVIPFRERKRTSRRKQSSDIFVI